MAEATSDSSDVLELLTMFAQDSEFSSDSEEEEELEWLYLQLVFSSETVKGPPFNMEDCTEPEFEQLFRFKKTDFARLLAALQLPVEYHCAQKTVSSAKEALLILLRRLAYPNRWCDLALIFGRTESELSLIFREILQDIYRRFHHLLEDLENLVWVDVSAFANAVQSAGAPLDNCWGFIDGTARAIARPVRNQRIMYSGHKRFHCLKFQAVTTPNGLIANMFGPIAGRHHNAYMLNVSGLQGKLASFTKQVGTPYVIYGEPAYGVSHTILAPYRGSHLTPQQESFNRSMSRVRVSVEWTFGKVITNFAYLDFKRGNKLLLQPIGKCYMVAALLTNCHTCLYGSQTSTFFGMDPPSLEQYLSNI